MHAHGRHARAYACMHKHSYMNACVHIDFRMHAYTHARIRACSHASNKHTECMHTHTHLTEEKRQDESKSDGRRPQQRIHYEVIACTHAHTHTVNKDSLVYLYYTSKHLLRKRSDCPAHTPSANKFLVYLYYNRNIYFEQPFLYSGSVKTKSKFGKYKLISNYALYGHTPVTMMV